MVVETNGVMMFFNKMTTIFSFMRPSKKEKYRTLVLVGSQGEAISIKRFLGLTLVTTLLLIATVIAIIYLVFLSSGLRKENAELKEALNEYQLKTKSLINENDILMARLVAGSEGKSSVYDTQKSAVEKPSNAPPSYEVLDPLDIEEEIKKAGQRMEEGRAFEKTVEVENLVVSHESSTKTLRVRFDLRSVDPNVNPVEGRTVVILKTGDQNYNNWLTLPFVPLVSGKPASTTTGRTFLISRFKTVKFSVAGQNNPNRFKNATVFVFSKTGETLMEKDFTVEVKGVSASAASENS